MQKFETTQLKFSALLGSVHQQVVHFSTYPAPHLMVWSSPLYHWFIASHTTMAGIASAVQCIDHDPGDRSWLMTSSWGGSVPLVQTPFPKESFEWHWKPRFWFWTHKHLVHKLKVSSPYFRKSRPNADGTITCRPIHKYAHCALVTVHVKPQTAGQDTAPTGRRRRKQCAFILKTVTLTSGAH